MSGQATVASLHLRMASIAGFFAVKMAIGAAIIFISARALGVEDFAGFSQLFLLAGYMTLLAPGGTANGVIQRIAAAREDPAAEGDVVRAALVVWATTSLTIIAMTLLFASPLSRLLVGDTRLAGLLPWLGGLVAMGGLGQLFAAILTGRGWTVSSLGFQAIGTILGGIGALAMLLAGRPFQAVFAFVAGPLAAALLAMPALREAARRGHSGAWRKEIRALLAHAAAFVAVAAVPPLVLFGVRGAYQGVYGLTTLGYWLAANRVSDMSTQVFGLYLAQVFLPAMSAIPPGGAARRQSAATALIGGALFLVPLGVFLLAPTILIETFLGRAFVPAVPFIAGYMTGDALRAATSVAMMSALARGRPRLYAGIELTASALFAVFALLLIRMDVRDAPWLAYMGSHLSIAVCASLWLLSREKLQR